MKFKLIFLIFAMLLFLIPLIPSVFAGGDLNGTTGPHSTIPEDYNYWNNGDQVFNGTTLFHPSNGTALSATACKTTTSTLDYTEDKNKFGNMSIEANTGGANDLNQCLAGIRTENVTFQIVLFDDASDTVGIIGIQLRNSTKAIINTGISATSTTLYMYELFEEPERVTNISRVDGGINFTIYIAPERAYMALWINKTLIVNDTTNIGEFQILQMLGGAIDAQFDDIKVWNGTPTDQPTGVSPPPPVTGFKVTVKDTYDSTAINNFTVILSNSTDVFINSTTTGSINYDNLTAGIYTIGINSTEGGGYFNRTFENINVSPDFQADIFQAILRINATGAITNVSITNFEVHVPLSSNTSNSSGLSTLFLKAGNYNISINTSSHQTTGTNFSISNNQDNLLTIIMGTSNLTITATGPGGTINDFNSTMTLLITGFRETRETNNGKVVFPTIAGTFNVTLNSTDFSLASQTITIASGNFFPNITFNLFSLNSINISIFDEETNELINYTTATLIMDHENQRFTNTTNSGSSFFIDLFDGLWELLASTPFHSQRKYIFTIVPQTTSTLNVFLLNTTNGELKTFTVKNKKDQTIPDATVSISNKINNTFVTIAQDITNFAGQVNIFLSSTNEYRFTIEAAEFTTKVFDLVPVVSEYNIIMDPVDTIDFTTVFDRVNFAILPSGSTITPQQAQNFSIITSSELGFIAYFGLNTSFNTSVPRIVNVTGSPAGGTASLLLNTTSLNSTTIPITFFIKLNGEDDIIIHRTYRTSSFITPGNFSAQSFADTYRDRFSNVFKALIVVLVAVAVIISLAEMGSPAAINGVAGAAVIIAGAVFRWIPVPVAFIVGFITIGMYLLRRGD